MDSGRKWFVGRGKSQKALKFKLTMPVWLTSTHQAIMMKLPQVGRAITALHVQGRGKSALHGARRRITSGAGNAERREPAGTGPQKQTAAR
jgi:hypothetical protein